MVPDMMAVLDQAQVVWILIVGFILTFLLAFSIGANSVANAFGTSVGAKVLTHFQAVILAAIFMTLGAVIIGPAVADTIENEIVNIQLYKRNPEVLMLGQISVILACALWKILATTFKIPVAATHSVVGAVIGFHFVATGFNGIYWESVILIAISWVTSPLLSGIVAVVLYFIVVKAIVEKEDPLQSGAKSLPIWLGSVVFINVLSIFLQLQSVFDKFAVPWYVSVAYSFGIGLVAALLVWCCLVPRLTKNEEIEQDALSEGEKEHLPIEDNINELITTSKCGESNFSEEQGIRLAADWRFEEEVDLTGDNPEVGKLCTPLLLVSVIFSAYAYGSILVSISVAPLITIWDVYETGNVKNDIENPFWTFIFGSVALIAGFAFVGGRLIETVGEGITSLSPSSAFPIELGASLVLFVASNLGIPVSTAHCKIGAIAAVGCYSDGGVDFRLLSKIVFAWVVTLPVTSGLSAGFMALFQLMFTTDLDVLTSNSTSFF